MPGAPKLMMSTISRICACRVCLILTVFFSLIAVAEATWVRGRGNTNLTGILDQLIVGIPPNPPIPSVATVQFNDGQKGMFAQSDLGNGALRGRAFVNGGSGSSGANPILGETLTFNNTTGSESSWDFTFQFDGTVQTGANPFPIVQDFGGGQVYRTTFIQFGLHIFPGHTVGPIGSDKSWLDQFQTAALFTQVKDMDGFPLSGDLQNFSANLTDQISGSLPLQPGVNTFDVVTIISVQGNIPSTTDSSFDFDFLDTAEISIDSEVPFTSDSGLFLTGDNVVPEPAALALAGLAMLTMLSNVRRRYGRRYPGVSAGVCTGLGLATPS